MPNLFATIIHTTGVPHAYYPSKQHALSAAKRLHRRTHQTVEVVWCKERGNPKLWLAMVDATGVTFDDNWREV